MPVIVTFKCERCGKEAECELLASFQNGPARLENGEVYPTLDGDPLRMLGPKHHHFCRVFRCPRCEGITIAEMVSVTAGRTIMAPDQVLVGQVVDYMMQERGELGDLVGTFPTGETINIEQYCTPEIVELFDDAHKALSAKMRPQVVAGLMGACCEAICNEQNAEGRNLYEKIKDLADRNIVTVGIMEWMQEMRKARNAALHEGVATQEEVDELFSFLKTLIDVVYALPRKIQNRRAHQA